MRNWHFCLTPISIFHLQFILDSLRVNWTPFRDKKKATKSWEKEPNEASLLCNLEFHPFPGKHCDTPHKVTPGNNSLLFCVCRRQSPDMGNKSKQFASALTLSAGWALPEALTPLSHRLSSWMHGVKRLVISQTMRNKLSNLSVNFPHGLWDQTCHSWAQNQSSVCAGHWFHCVLARQHLISFIL